MSYKLNQRELLIHWDDQIKFLNSSSKSYDNGIEAEAKRMSISLRILFHQTKNSNALIKQLNLHRTFPLWSSGDLYTPSNLIPSWSLLSIAVKSDSISYLPHLSSSPSRTFFLCYEDWWNEIIIEDKTDFLTRKDIVQLVADQDGGAHVDSILNEKYARLVKKNSLGRFFHNPNGISSGPINNPAYACLRQISHEVLFSWELHTNHQYSRISPSNRCFEVRFVDDTRRFKWSSTDIQTSPETNMIIEKYPAYCRRYYIDRFANGKSREVIWI